MPSVLYYIQHLWGLGHGRRAAAIARSMIDIGWDVTYVSGGFSDTSHDLRGVKHVSLPPLKAENPEEDGLIGESGAAPNTNFWDQRRHLLMEAFESAAPDLLLIETFPFGRWPFRVELEPLLDVARNKCAIVCSIRDILEPKAEDRRNRQIVDLIDRSFDLVLVHGDTEFMALDRTFALAPEIAGKTRYTGYVSAGTTARSSSETDGPGEVIVSAGGGATCASLMRAAADAAMKDGRTWRFLIGPNCPSTVRKFMSKGTNIVVEPIRPDFPDLLGRADASISQAGYNTTMDIVTCGVPAVMVPYQGMGQTEQYLRAERLADLGRVALVPESNVSDKTLLAALKEAECGQSQLTGKLNLNGAVETADILANFLKTRISTKERI
jgi:predicted glycosyltransferase